MSDKTPTPRRHTRVTLHQPIGADAAKDECHKEGLAFVRLGGNSMRHRRLVEQSRVIFWALCGISLAALVSGCASFSQKYFIEVEEMRPGWPRPHSQFSRLDLSGHAFLTASKFEKGWYDKNGVDSLFSTVVGQVAAASTDSSPTLQTATATSQSESSESDESRPNWRRMRVFGPAGEVIKVDGKRLVIFVTSDPAQVLSRIETSARTAETSGVFANLLIRPEVKEAQDAELMLSLASKRQESLLIDLDAFLKWLDALEEAKGADAAELRREIGWLIKKTESAMAAR